MSKKTILILAANPADSEPLRLGDEMRRINDALQLSLARERFHVVQEWAVGPMDVHRAMLRYRPQIVHFMGHGEGEEGILLQNADGEASYVDADALASLFAHFAFVECVLLNACLTEIQAEAIAQHIDHVVGMSQAVGDEAALAFAEGFYTALFAEEPFESAHSQGRTVIQMMGIDEHLTPVLFGSEQSIEEPEPIATHLPTIDRQPAIDLFQQLIQPDSSFRILRLLGEGKMGKSHLLKKIFPQMALQQGQTLCAVLDVRNQMRNAIGVLHDLVVKLQEEAEWMGLDAPFARYQALYQEWQARPIEEAVDLQTMLAQVRTDERDRTDPDRQRLDQMTRAFAQDLGQLQSQRLVLLFDAINDANDATQTWLLESLLVQIARLSQVRVVLAARHLPELSGARMLTLCRECRLSAVTDLKEYVSYCQERKVNLDEPSIQLFAQATNFAPGHFAELMANL